MKTFLKYVENMYDRESIMGNRQAMKDFYDTEEQIDIEVEKKAFPYEVLYWSTKGNLVGSYFRTLEQAIKEFHKARSIKGNNNAYVMYNGKNITKEIL